MGHLDVATVSYTLPDGRPLLRNVAFSLGTGEQVAVVGANGAGKSTLLRIVMGQLSPDSGIVTCDGNFGVMGQFITCLLYTSPSPRDRQKSRMPSSA